MLQHFVYFFFIFTTTLPSFAFVLPLLRTDAKFACSRFREHNNVKRYASTEVTKSSETEKTTSSYSSYIASIRSCNLAGTVSDGNESDICITLGDGPNLVAVTGESGTGKSMLIAKAADLLTGGKAASSAMPATVKGGTFVEMEIRLSEPHLTMVEQSLTAIGLDPSVLDESNYTRESSPMGMLILRRDLAIENERIKSTCAVNGQTVSLKALRIVSRPLLAIVDAAAAAAALAKQNSRMSIIDTAVPPPILSYARLTRAEYRKCRGYRLQLEKELSNRMLPVSMSGKKDDDKDIELLQHWIDELDAFEQRIGSFVATLGGQAIPGSNVATATERLSCTSWFDDSSSSQNVGSNEEEEAFSSALYSNLVEFREAIKSLEQQVEAARNARDALSSLSLPESAVTALERTRNHLFDATGNESTESLLSAAAERSHDLLNRVEDALKACAKSIEDDRAGVLTMLEHTRDSIQVSLEDVDILLGDWSTLARKHGMSPFALPACHKALKSELTGNVEARLLLPEAKAAEADALDKFETACSMLTSARQKVAKQVSLAVSQRLPSLGMEGSTFVADLQGATRNCTDISAYSANARLGIDSIDFLLNHGTSSDTKRTRNNAKSIGKGGKVEMVASSGEKARILLAIECELPGSIGAINRASLWNDTGLDFAVEQIDSALATAPPVAVIYDEIDAHVGGRAAVAMANMLADQSSGIANDGSVKGQVVSITHSPSVAAIADMHILIQRQRNGRRGNVPVTASVIEGAERRNELARMASGDLAPDEAQTFADALLRDGAKRRRP